MLKLLFVAFLLSGCATQPEIITETNQVLTPVCSGKIECDAMWLRARDALEAATSMRIRSMSDVVIETYRPATFGYMGGIAIKYPIDVDKYEIRLRLECYGHTQCGNQKINATNLFNSMTGGKWINKL